MSASVNSQQPRKQLPAGMTPWKPGQSGNPAGRPKGIEAKAREFTDAAIATLVRELSNPRNCVPAAVALLDRGWGKPKQPVSGDPDNPITWVIRGPAPTQSTQEWLLEYAPKTIDANSEVSDATNPVSSETNGVKR